MSVKIVTDDSFATDVLGAGLPVLVDFFAEWCAPCKQMEPHLQSFADDSQGRLVVAKMDIDQNPVTPGEYGLRGVPTLILFRDGKQLATHVGPMSREHIRRWFDEHAGADAPDTGQS